MALSPPALMVLHTWNQKLDAHAHVHAVVPGLRTGARRQRSSLRPAGWRCNFTIGRYLVDADQLRQRLPRDLSTWP